MRPISAESAVCLTLGTLALVAGLLALTKFERTGRFTPSRGLSEAVADPDIVVTPHLRRHVE